MKKSASIIPFPGPYKPHSASFGSQIMFDREELYQIMQIYGRLVAAGVWRDYAISEGQDTACFAIHRHSSEQPLYQILKTPALRARQSLYRVTGQGNTVLKRGNHLPTVLRVFDKKSLHRP
jgi:hypothetical protein